MGEEVYGPDWRCEWIDDPESPERKLTLKYLHAALRSGQVIAHWSAMDFRSEGDLNPQDADREFFRIDLKNDCVFHHSVNELVFCRIHKDQLSSFIKRQGRRTVPATYIDAEKCYEWLVQEFSNPDYHPPIFEDHLRLAKARFPRLTDRAFKDARKRAIAFTKRQDIAKPGRRKKPISS